MKYIYKQMESQQTIQQFALNNNYVKERQKIEERRSYSHNNSFNIPFGQHFNGRKINSIKMKRKQIQSENQQLKTKLERLYSTSVARNSKIQLRSETNDKQTNQSNPMNYRYRQDKIQATSDDQGHNTKYCVPTAQRNKIRYGYKKGNFQDHMSLINKLQSNKQKQLNIDNRKQAISLSYSNKYEIKQNPERANKLNSFQNSIQVLQYNSKFKRIIKEAEILNKQGKQTENDSYRLVVFKKTKILQPMKAYVIQISLLQNQILIMAFGTGTASSNYKYLISKKRSQQILADIAGQYEILFNKIQIEHGLGIKILGGNDETKISGFEILSLQKKQNIKRLEITQDFLRRNYFSLLKNIQENRQKVVQSSKNEKQKMALSRQNKALICFDKNKNIYQNENKNKNFNREKRQQNSFNDDRFAKISKNIVQNKLNNQHQKNQQGNFGFAKKKLKNDNDRFKKIVKEVKVHSLSNQIVSKVKSINKKQKTETKKQKIDQNQVKVEIKKNSIPKKLKKTLNLSNCQNYDEQFEDLIKEDTDDEYYEQNFDQINQISLSGQPKTQNISQQKSKPAQSSVDESNNNYEEQFDQQDDESIRYEEDFESNPSKTQLKQLSNKAVKHENMKNSSLIEEVENNVAEQKNEQNQIIDECTEQFRY